MQIRAETPDDHGAISAVHRAAFETAVEANLVSALRERAEPLISLVAELEGEGVTGHILFSPVTLEGDDDVELLGLAPMAVLPAHQHSGIGSGLVVEGLRRCRDAGADGVVVLGHPEYYPRFGFTPAARHGLACEYDVPSDVFMAIELAPGALAGRHGRVLYHPAFGEL